MKGPICCWLTSVTETHFRVIEDEVSEDCEATSKELLRSPVGQRPEIRRQGQEKRPREPSLGTKLWEQEIAEPEFMGATL